MHKRAAGKCLMVNKTPDITSKTSLPTPHTMEIHNKGGQVLNMDETPQFTSETAACRDPRYY